MPDPKIDNDAAVEFHDIDGKSCTLYCLIRMEPEWAESIIRRHLALVKAAQEAAREMPRWILGHGLEEVDNAAGDDVDLSCISCHQTSHEWRSIEHKNGKYCHVGRVTRAILALEALLPTEKEDV